MAVARILLILFLALGSKPSAHVTPKESALPNPGAPSVARDVGTVAEGPAQRPARSSGWGGSIGAMERNVRISLERAGEQRKASSMSAARKSAMEGIAAKAPLAVTKDSGLPQRIWFGPPTPNPTDRRVAFRVDLPAAGHLRLSVVDVGGRVVHVIDERREAGKHVLTWDGQDRRGRVRPAGVYFARLFVDGISAGSQRVIFVH